MKAIYEVICTYEIEADSKAAADRCATAIAHSLERMGVIARSSTDAKASLKRTHKRFQRFIAGRGPS